MLKLESSLKNMVLVLVGVALVVGAVLAYINHLTSGPIAEKAAQSLATGIKSVMGTEDLQVAEPEEVKQEFGGKRSEERRVGKECLRLCRSRWSPYH